MKIEKKSLYNINFLLIISYCLLPLALITGPFLSDFLLLMLIILSIFKKNFFFKNYYFIFFLFFYIYLNITSLFSDDVLFSLKSTLGYIRFGLFFFVTSLLFVKVELFFKKLLISLLIIFFLLIFDSFFQFFVGHNLVGLKQIDPERINSFFYSKQVLGSFIVRFFPILCGLVFFYGNQKYKIYLLIFTIPISIIVMLSGEKNAFGLLLIELFFIYLFYLYTFNRKTLLITIPLVLSIFLVVNYSPLTTKRLFKEAIINSENGKYIFSRVHDSHFRTAIKMFKESPIIGVGPNMFRKLCNNDNFIIDEFSCSTHPHNFYLQLLAETGIFGFCFIFFIFLYISFFFGKSIFFLVKKKKINATLFFFNLSAFINLFPISTTGNFFNNWNSIIIFFCINLFFAYKNCGNLK
jgi:O-antigen ligase